MEAHGTVEGLIQNATYRWDGSTWKLYKFVAENIEVDQLSAITADLGLSTPGRSRCGDKRIEFNNAFSKTIAMETPDGTVQGYIHYNGNTQIKDGDIVIDSIGEESGLNFEEVTKMSCKGLSSVMYNGLKDSADANFLHSAALTEGMLILRDSNGNVGTLDAQILKTILGRFDTTNG